MTAEELEAALAALPPSTPTTPEPMEPPVSASKQAFLATLSPAGRTIHALLGGMRVSAELSASDETRRQQFRAARLAQIASARTALECRLNPRLVVSLNKARSPCALLIGPTGCGKTSGLHWLAAGLPGYLVHARELGSSERRHGLGVGYPPELIRAREERVLYLDDLGAEEPRDTAALQFVIDYRYARGLATAATSGLSMVELRRHLGAAYVRRLVEQHVPRSSGGEWPVLFVDCFSLRLAERGAP